MATITREDIIEMLETGPIIRAIDEWQEYKINCFHEQDRTIVKAMEELKVNPKLRPLFQHIVKLNDQGKTLHEIYLAIKDTRIGDDYNG